MTQNSDRVAVTSRSRSCHSFQKLLGLPAEHKFPERNGPFSVLVCGIDELKLSSWTALVQMSSFRVVVSKWVEQVQKGLEDGSKNIILCNVAV